MLVRSSIEKGLIEESEDRDKGKKTFDLIMDQKKNDEILRFLLVCVCLSFQLHYATIIARISSHSSTIRQRLPQLKRIVSVRLFSILMTLFRSFRMIRIFRLKLVLQLITKQFVYHRRILIVCRKICKIFWRNSSKNIIVYSIHVVEVNYMRAIIVHVCSRYVLHRPKVQWFQRNLTNMEH